MPEIPRTTQLEGTTGLGRVRTTLPQDPTGRTLQRAGQVVGQVGGIIRQFQQEREQNNRLAAQDISTKVAEGTNQIARNPKDGLLNTRKEQSIDITSKGLQKFDKMVDKLVEGADRDVRERVRRSTAQMRIRLESQLSSHESQQKSVATVDNANAAVANKRSGAITGVNAGDFFGVTGNSRDFVEQVHASYQDDQDNAQAELAMSAEERKKNDRENLRATAKMALDEISSRIGEDFDTTDLRNFLKQNGDLLGNASVRQWNAVADRMDTQLRKAQQIQLAQGTANAAIRQFVTPQETPQGPSYPNIDIAEQNVDEALEGAFAGDRETRLKAFQYKDSIFTELRRQDKRTQRRIFDLAAERLGEDPGSGEILINFHESQGRQKVADDLRKLVAKKDTATKSAAQAELRMLIQEFGPDEDRIEQWFDENTDKLSPVEYNDLVKYRDNAVRGVNADVLKDLTTSLRGNHDLIKGFKKKPDITDMSRKITSFMNWATQFTEGTGVEPRVVTRDEILKAGNALLADQAKVINADNFARIFNKAAADIVDKRTLGQISRGQREELRRKLGEQ